VGREVRKLLLSEWLAPAPYFLLAPRWGRETRARWDVSKGEDMPVVTP